MRRKGLVAAMLAVGLLAGCDDKLKSSASQTAAKVNKAEVTVHQINFVLQQQRNLRPDQTDSAALQVLERLIDQELALQMAIDLKLDRDPRVVQQLQAAQREVIARAYLEKVGEAAASPTPEEIKKYYEDMPALFKERRVYSLQEIAIEATPDQAALLREKLGSSKNITEFVEFLKANDFKLTGSQAVRAAEQLPLQSLDMVAKMTDGQAMMNQTSNGVEVLLLASSRRQPMSEEQARPAIEQFLLNERKRKLVEDDMKSMRTAAKIEYVGKFGEKAAPGTTPAAALASDLNATNTTKGMGLK